MNFGQVVKYFGNVREASKALDYTTQAIYKWQNEGIPLRTQRTIQFVTGGKLKADKVQK